MRALVVATLITTTAAVFPQPSEARGSKAAPQSHAASATPDWERRPGRCPMRAYYPARAQTMHVTGSATLKCFITKYGAATACQVVSEQPVRMGFGAAALALADCMTFKPKMVDGVAVDGDEQTFPLNFNLR